MADPSPEPDKPKRVRKIPWRPWLRAIHRDVGYLVVGLTIIYAVSGLAINHLHQWNPNFKEYETHHEVGVLPSEEQAAIAAVLERLDIDEQPVDAYEAAPGQIEIEFAARVLHVDTASGKVHEEGSESRFFFRVANWLHYNRSKQAWTYIADAYAILLLYLAFSGLFMLKGRKGLIGRGGILVLVGAAVPLAYVIWSGGP